MIVCTQCFDRYQYSTFTTVTPMSTCAKCGRRCLGYGVDQTITEKILEEVQRQPYQTSTQIAHKIDETPANVSSKLYRALKTGKVTRRAGGGKSGAEWFISPV